MVGRELDRAGLAPEQCRITSGGRFARYRFRFAAEVTGWKETVMDQAVFPRPAKRCRENPRDRSPTGADVEDGQSDPSQAVVGQTR